MIPFQPGPEWYQRHWEDEAPNVPLQPTASQRGATLLREALSHLLQRLRPRSWTSALTGAGRSLS
jgi:hypothetical protein